jgi:hypothetical protein
MGTKDVTRLLDQPEKHYASVRLQEGRSLLDSDFNEGESLLAAARRRALLDVLGPKASPDEGFSLGSTFSSPFHPPALHAGRDQLPVERILLNGQLTNVHGVVVRAGSIYLGGMRFELGEPERFATQRGFLQMKPSDVPHLERSPSPSPFSPRSPTSPDFGRFLDFYYLNAWEQAVTAVEDEELRERGLAGPDTSVRILRMRRVEVLGNLHPIFGSCGAAFEELIRILELNAVFDRTSGELRSLARLQLVFQHPDQPTECPPCTPDPGAQYLGSENQALRIMLTTARTFVWAFDAAAPLYRIKVTGLGSPNPGSVLVKMLTPPKDQEHEPRRNRVVEIIPFGAILEGGEGLRPDDRHFQKIADEVGVFVRVAEDYDPTDKSFHLELGSRIQAIQDFVHQWDSRHPAASQLNLADPDSDARYFYMRVWHQADDPGDIEQPIAEDPNGHPLGDTGIIPVFHHAGRRGDFWVAALRVDTPQRIVPFDLLSESSGVAPHGPRHFYAPLAVVQGDDDDVFSVSDCRVPIRLATDRGCVTRTVGDGISSRGDFLSIPAAIASLPPDGGIIEVRPGVYPGPIAITGRGHITLQGCGESTVIQTPGTGAGNALVHLDGASALTISNLRLQAAEQTALLVQNSHDVKVDRVRVVAGQLSGATFVPEAGTSDAPLIDVGNDPTGVEDAPVDTVGLTLRALQVTPGRRSVLHVRNAESVRVEGLRAAGKADAPTAPAAPMLDFQDTRDLVVTGGALSAFGQVGVSVARGDGVTLRGLDVTVGPHQATAGAVEARSAVDIEGSSRVRLEESRLLLADAATSHAVVIAQGDDVVIESCDVEALVSKIARAWGGLQIRGGSNNVQIRENHIHGGLGHGITLGSVRWSDGSSFDRGGAGRAQITSGTIPTVTGDLRGGFIDPSGTVLEAVDEGPVQDIVVAENRIEEMGTCGISALTVLGLPERDLIDVRAAVIERNTIQKNLRQISNAPPVVDDVLPFSGSAEATGLGIRTLPFAGISLAVASGSLDVRGNSITNNGTSNTLPTSGIFVLLGDNIVVSENRIADNGTRISAGIPAETGVRAGIAVILAGSGFTANLAGLDSLLAGTGSVLSTSDSALRVFHNSVRQPEGRALHAIAIGPVNVHDNFLSSTGNHGADTLVERSMIGDVVFIENLSPPWESHDAAARLGSPSGEFKEVAPHTVAHLLNQDSPPGYFLSLGGPVLFHNNQVTYDWDFEITSPTPPVSSFPIALLSLDHVGASGNECALRLRGSTPPAFGSPGGFAVNTPLLAHLFAVGGTVDVAGNRLAEEVSSIFFSIITFADVLNVTAYNQGTHLIVAFKKESIPENGDDHFMFRQFNQVLFRPRSSPTESQVEEGPLADYLLRFFKLMERI